MLPHTYACDGLRSSIETLDGLGTSTHLEHLTELTARAMPMACGATNRSSRIEKHRLAASKEAIGSVCVGSVCVGGVQAAAVSTASSLKHSRAQVSQALKSLKHSSLSRAQVSQALKSAPSHNSCHFHMRCWRCWPQVAAAALAAGWKRCVSVPHAAWDCPQLYLEI